MLVLSCSDKKQIEPYKIELLKLEMQRSNKLENFKPFLQAKNPEIVYSALEAMTKIQDSVFIDVYSSFIQDKNRKIRLKAIEGLGQSFNKDAKEALMAAFPHTTDSTESNTIVQSLMKVVTKDDLSFIHDLIVKNEYEHLAYDLVAAQRRVPEFSVLSSTIYKNWPSFNSRNKAGYVYFLSRLEKKEIDPFSKILEDEFLARVQKKDVESAIVSADIITCLAKTSCKKDELIKKYYNASANWRIVRSFLSLMRFTKKNYSEKIYNLLVADSLHPNIKRYILENLESLKVKQDVYSFLLNEDLSENYTAIAQRYPEQTVRYFNQRFQLESAFNQSLLIKALFKTKSKKAVLQLADYFPNLELAVQTEFVDQASQTTLFPDSLYLNILKNNDLAHSYLISDYAVKHKKVNYVEALQESFTNMNEKTDLETMLHISNALGKLNPKNSKKWASESIAKVKNSELKASLSAILGNRSFVELEKNTTVYPYESILSSKRKTIEIVMNTGRIKIKLLTDIAPIACYNIVTLANRGFYNGLTFHRLAENFVAQAGDPRGDGWGGPGYSIPCEYTKQRFEYGTVGIATSGKDTGSSQFFIMQRYAPHLDGKYTTFGKVTQGFDVLENIQKGDRIFSINVL